MIIFSTLAQHILLSDGKKKKKLKLLLLLLSILKTSSENHIPLLESLQFFQVISTVSLIFFIDPEYLSLQPFPEVSFFCGLVGSILTIDLFSRHFPNVIGFYFFLVSQITYIQMHLKSSCIHFINWKKLRLFKRLHPLLLDRHQHKIALSVLPISLLIIKEAGKIQSLGNLLFLFSFHFNAVCLIHVIWLVQNAFMSLHFLEIRWLLWCSEVN